MKEKWHLNEKIRPENNSTGILLILISIYQWYAITNNLSPVAAVQNLLNFLTQGFWGPLIYILFYTIRPLILFPSTILTLAGGFVFGPVMGVVYTIIASNISSTLAFFVGGFFGKDLLKDDGSDSLIQRYARRMRENSFETVMIMRFIFLPYDDGDTTRTLTAEHIVIAT